jgi:hypothetical protein
VRHGELRAGNGAATKRAANFSLELSASQVMTYARKIQPT